MKRFSDFAEDSNIMLGDKIRVDEILGEEIVISKYRVGESKYEGKQLLTLQIKLEGEDRIVFTGSEILIDQCQKYEDKMPFITVIEKVNNRFYSFT